MPVNHDEVIKALCAKAAKVDNVSKKLDSKSRLKQSPPSPVTSASSSEKNLQKVFDALCAKAKDVAVASKISEASEQFGRLSPSPVAKAPAKVVASLCVQASAFQLNDDDDEKEYAETVAQGSLSKKYDDNFDHENSTTSSSSGSDTSDQVGYPRRASITSCSPTRISTLSSSTRFSNSPTRITPRSITNSPTYTSSPTHFLASLNASSSTFHLFDDDETATYYDETTTDGSSTNQFRNNYDQNSDTAESTFGLQVSNTYTSPRRAARLTSPSRAAVSLGIQSSTFHLFDDDETATHHDESTVVSPNQLCCETLDRLSSKLRSSALSETAASMTSEELSDLAKSLVTAPSGGHDATFSVLRNQGPPPRVMLNTRSTSDTSITSELTDWDFGLSKDVTVSLSEFDADKVVENFYKMAATDPVLARRIALAATSAIKAEDTRGINSEGAKIGKVHSRSFSTLATVCECEDTSDEMKVKSTTTKLSTPKHFKTGGRTSELPPRAKPVMKPRVTSSTNSDRQRKTAKRIHPKMERNFTAVGFEPCSPRSRSDSVGSNQTKEDPPGRTSRENAPGFCFIQDNAKTHR